MTQVVHCRKCGGQGREWPLGYDQYSVACLTCRGAGIVDASEEQVAKWQEQDGEHRRVQQARHDAELRRGRTTDILACLGIVVLLGTIGLLAGHPFIGSGIGIIVALWFWAN